MSPEPLPPGVGGSLHHREPPPGVGYVRVCHDELVHADPVVLMSGKLLAMWHEEDGVPPVGELICSGTCPVGDVVKINGATRRAVYVVIGTYRDWPDTFVLRWPD